MAPTNPCNVSDVEETRAIAIESHGLRVRLVQSRSSWNSDSHAGR